MKEEMILPVVEQHTLFWDRRIVILFQLTALSQAAPSYWCLFPQLLLFDIQFRDARTPLLRHIVYNVNAAMTLHPRTAFMYSVVCIYLMDKLVKGSKAS